MTIDEAIKVLAQDITYIYPARFDDLQSAIKLGIEALKLVERQRVRWAPVGPKLLPGETKD